MQNGMENASFTYKIVEGIPSQKIFDHLIALYSELFEDADLPLKEDLKSKMILLLSLPIHLIRLLDSKLDICITTQHFIVG